MFCAHCGMNCTRHGENMSFATFKKAIECNDCITIGGGEPTIHPHFEKFLLYAIAHCESVFIITNGKKTDTALALARLINDERFGAELSQDPYHESIDEKVVRAFEGRIRDTSLNLINAGRCDWGKDDCICEGDAFVKPNGDVRQCGCADSPKVGTVFDNEIRPITSPDSKDEWGEWICYKKIQGIKKIKKIA